MDITDRSRRLLIITYSFPPVSSPAAIRMLKFAKVLASRGWEVHVLCPANTAQKRRDALLVRQIPATVKVYRAPMIDLSGFQSQVRERLKSTTDADVMSAGNASCSWLGWLKKIKGGLLYPDVQAAWHPMLYLYGSLLCLRNGYDTILATGDPWSVVLAGMRLAGCFRIPFAADFRELWSGHAHANHLDQKVRERIKKSEQSIFAGASLVIGNSPDERAILESTCRVADRPRFTDLQNGFDAEDILRLFDRTGSLKRNGAFTMAYAGSFYYRRPDAFFEAICDWLVDYPELSSRIRVNIAGIPEDRVVRLATDLGLTDIVHFLGYLTYDKALAMMLGADMLLAILGTPRNRGYDPTVPAKMYEYIALGRPILLMSKPGGATRFFESVGAFGAVADNDSPAQIRAALEHFYDLYRKDALPLRCPIKAGAYTREAIARRLSDQLLTTASSPGRFGKLIPRKRGSGSAKDRYVAK